MKKTWRVIVLVAIVMASLMGVDKAFAATMADVQKEAERGGYQLITTDKLWEMVNREPGKTLLVDTRQGWEYAAGHIQGAVNFPMEPTWLARLTHRGELEQFLGSDRGRQIVFY